jgi:hypothetical protein
VAHTPPPQVMHISLVRTFLGENGPVIGVEQEKFIRVRMGLEFITSFLAEAVGKPPGIGHDLLLFCSILP